MKSRTVPVSNIDDVKHNPNITVLMNELCELQKHSPPCVVFFPQSIEKEKFRRALLEVLALGKSSESKQ